MFRTLSLLRAESVLLMKKTLQPQCLIHTQVQNPSQTTQCTVQASKLSTRGEVWALDSFQSLLKETRARHNQEYILCASAHAHLFIITSLADTNWILLLLLISTFIKQC